MTGAWGRILDKYGQRVAVVRDGAEILCRAFLQPALETREDWFQSLPTPWERCGGIGGSTWGRRR